MSLISYRKKIEQFFIVLNRLAFINLILSKVFCFKLKLSNNFLNIYEFSKKKEHLKSFPNQLSLNITNLCNYRCKFCEIHYFYKFAKETSGKVFPNHINLSFLNKFHNLFERLKNVELSGATGEPLVNPIFIQICRKLKAYKIEISTTSNGALLDQNIIREIVKMKFNHIMISLHSGEEKVYNELQGGDFNRIVSNLQDLIKIREENNSKLPRVSVNCLLFKPNHHTITKLIKILNDIGIDDLNINQYYDARNKIEGEVSYYFDSTEGNKVLKEIYKFAKDLNFKLTPKIPNYINIDKETVNINKKICNSPWMQLKLKGCVEYENSHYVCLCNRIILFRLNYEEFEGNFIEDIWNHEIIKYFRRHVINNPVCQFCINPETLKVRCINNKEYQTTRDMVIEQFFKTFYEKTKVKPRKGIYLLDKFPYEYREDVIKSNL